MVPTGGAGCSGPRPILLYAHGTDTDKNLNLADITDPSNSEGALIAAMFAAHGYIVVAPNYTGYDSSSLPYHPYLNAAAQSADMIDALIAARKALGHISASGTTDGGKLFITGYSQGGYVAMATHKAMQAANMAVTASAPMSGPYALEAFSDAVFFGKVNLGSTIFTPLLTTSYQKSYGGMYTATSDVFETTFASTAEGLLPSTVSIDELIATGKLPQLALFTDMPVPTGSALLDAVLAPSADPLFSLGFGTPNLVTQGFRVSYLQDALAHPDGAVPAVTNLLPSATALLPFRQKLALNDLRTWVPAAPVLMCGGHQDPVVFFSVNTTVMKNFWTLVAPAPAGLVNVVDVDPSPNPPANLIQGGFAQTEAQIFAAKGQSGVVQTYHSTVAPFCSAAARGFFDSLQASI
jgi:pimeloyl-ACP methyl ester carboxylesterase